jgi:hypothetical protein
MPMITMTTSNSTSVKPWRLVRFNSIATSLRNLVVRSGQRGKQHDDWYL